MSNTKEIVKDKLQDMTSSMAEVMEVMLKATLKNDGDKSEDSQLICVLNSLNDLKASINGINLNDVRELDELHIDKKSYSEDTKSIVLYNEQLFEAKNTIKNKLKNIISVSNNIFNYDNILISLAKEKKYEIIEKNEIAESYGLKKITVFDTEGWSNSYNEEITNPIFIYNNNGNEAPHYIDTWSSSRFGKETGDMIIIENTSSFTHAIEIALKIPEPDKGRGITQQGEYETLEEAIDDEKYILNSSSSSMRSMR